MTQNNLFQTASNTLHTPMMQQYHSIKVEHQDCLLFYRLGDFYELFFEDAITAAPIIDVILTRRGKTNIDEQIPMCGVPYHSAQPYFLKLLKAGYKIAICEQMESPASAKKRGHKSVVNREVVRIMTPGTIVEDQMIENSGEQNLIALNFLKDEICIIHSDITTGKLWIQKIIKSSLSNELSRSNPKEIILPDKMYDDQYIKNILQPYKSILSIRSNSQFSNVSSEDKIKQFYNLISFDSLIKMDGLESSTLAALLEYITYTHKSAKLRFDKPKRINNSHYLEIDSSTRRNLELSNSISGKSNKTVINVLNKALTAMGKRLLAHHLAFPLINVVAINRRLDNIEFFINNNDLLKQILQCLTNIIDFERLLSKICSGRSNFQDLIYLNNALEKTLTVAEYLRNSPSKITDNLKTSLGQIGNFTNLSQILNDALIADIKSVIAHKYIKSGYSLELDKLYDLKDNSNTLILRLRDKYRAQTNVTNLKISFNNMLGYYIEVSGTHVNKITDASFVLRQALVNGSRFTTKELQDLENNILECEHKIQSEEAQILNSLCQKVIEFGDVISSCAHAIAQIDVSCCWATLAIKNNYTRPLLDDTNHFHIDLGRHPLVEHHIKSSFIPNSCDMQSNSNLWLITGPNMAGKSTYLRQNAIIIIMAQMGGYVPAKLAHIGVVDKLFSRIGAADDISLGLSTFAVEMVETANILNNATSKSFLILDEVGRGTSTMDGLAIAWAILENIHNNIKARTLFATHYHELTDLEAMLPNLICYTMRVKEWDGKVVFIHEVIKGKADKSYGIYVAKIAGIPKNVTERATEILDKLDHIKPLNIL